MIIKTIHILNLFIFLGFKNKQKNKETRHVSRAELENCHYMRDRPRNNPEVTKFWSLNTRLSIRQ